MPPANHSHYIDGRLRSCRFGTRCRHDKWLVEGCEDGGKGGSAAPGKEKGGSAAQRKKKGGSAAQKKENGGSAAQKKEKAVLTPAEPTTGEQERRVVAINCRCKCASKLRAIVREEVRAGLAEHLGTWRELLRSRSRSRSGSGSAAARSHRSDAASRHRSHRSHRSHGSQRSKSKESEMSKSAYE